MRIIVENVSNFKNQNQTRSQKEKFDERSDKDFKRKIYVMNESEKKNDSKSIEKDFFVEYFNDDEQAYYSKDLIYYDSDHSNETNQKSTINYFIVSMTIICRRCKKLFVFNNKLHRHFRQIDCLNDDTRSKKFFVVFNMKKSFVVFNMRKFFIVFNDETLFVVTIYVVAVSSVDVTKISFESVVVDSNVISIVFSNVDVFKDIEIDCDYRD